MKKFQRLSLTVAAVVGAGIVLVSPAAATESTPVATLGEVSALAPSCRHYINSDRTRAEGSCVNVTSGWKWRLGAICSGTYKWSNFFTRDGLERVRCDGRVSHAWIDKCYQGSCQSGRVVATEARTR